MTAVVDLISQFRMTVYEHFPYIAPYVYSLTPVERPGLGTMAVDKQGRMYWDPEWSNTLTLEQGGYVVIHEAAHLIFRHCHRASGIIGDNPSPQERRLYNIAVDLVVWEFMEHVKDLAPPGGVTLPEMQKLYPTIKPGMTVEEIYWIISQPKDEEYAKKDPQPGDDGEIADADGPGPGDDVPPSNEDDVGEPGPRDDADGAGEDSDSDEPGPNDDPNARRGSGEPEEGHPTDKFQVTESSAADGITNDYEDEADPTWGAFQEHNLLEACEKKIEQLENDHEWVSNRGTVPGSLKRHIRSVLRPSVNPWDALRSCVGRILANSKGNPDATYQRPSRRQAGMPDAVRLKGAVKKMPKACVVVDTSGSMSAGCLRKAITVIKQGLKAIGDCPVVTCDARIGMDIVMRSIADDFTFDGGGGTDMRIPLDYVEKKYKPDVVVLVTDTATPWPDKMKAKLIVAATQDGDCPPWSIKVRIPDDPNKTELDT